MKFLVFLALSLVIFPLKGFACSVGIGSIPDDNYQIIAPKLINEAVFIGDVEIVDIKRAGQYREIITYKIKDVLKKTQPIQSQIIVSQVIYGNSCARSPHGNGEKIGEVIKNEVLFFRHGEIRRADMREWVNVKYYLEHKSSNTLESTE